METICLYVFALIIDIVILIFLEKNNILIYIIITYILGIMIPIHTVKFKNIFSGLWKGRGLWLYDLVYVGAFSYIFFVIPPIYDDLIDRFD